jgi:hypothetical protein
MLRVINVRKILYGAIIVLSITYIIGCAGGNSKVVKSDVVELNHVNQYAELGRVRWLDSYSEALERAKSEKKPILVLIYYSGNDMVPDNSALNHPLAVEAIESLFVPVAFSGQQGNLEEGLGMVDLQSDFESVIQINDTNGNELVEKLYNTQTVAPVTEVLTASLSNAGYPVPEYLQVISSESGAEGTTETAVITQHCFWSGEVELGVHDAVVFMEPGYIDKIEAIRITFDNSKVSYKDLLETAKSLGLLNTAYPLNDKQYIEATEVIDKSSVKYFSQIEYAPASDRKNYKFYIGKTVYRYVPMTSRQALLVNNALFFEENPDVFLSPRQIEMYEFIKGKQRLRWENHIDSSNFTQNWIKTTAKIEKISKGTVLIH